MRPEPQHAPSFPLPLCLTPALAQRPPHLPRAAPGLGMATGPLGPQPRPGSPHSPQTPSLGLVPPDRAWQPPRHLLQPPSCSSIPFSHGPYPAPAPASPLLHTGLGLTPGPRPFSHTLGLYVSTGLTTAVSAPPHNLARINTTYLLKKTN